MRLVYGLMVLFALGCTGDRSVPAKKGHAAFSPTLASPSTTARSDRFVMSQQQTRPRAQSHNTEFHMETAPHVTGGVSRNGRYIVDAWINP